MATQKTSTTPRNRYKVAELKAQMREAIGSDHLEVEMEDGTVFTVPYPPFTTPEQRKLMRSVDENDEVAIAQILLADQWQAFKDGGYDPVDVVLAFGEASEDAQAALAGRKRPTR